MCNEKELIETVEELIKVIDKRSYDMTRAIEGFKSSDAKRDRY